MNSNSITKIIKRITISTPKPSTSYLPPLRSNSTASTSTLPSSSPSSSTSSTSYPPLPQGSRGTQLYYPSNSTITSHLNSLLSPLNLSSSSSSSTSSTAGDVLAEELAIRSMTHKSGDGHYSNSNNREERNNGNNGGGERDGAVRKGHGEKLSFVGRRILRLHLNLFLNTGLSHSPIILQTYLNQDSTDNLLDTKELGSGVGKVWGLEKVMRWREVRAPSGEPSGLYKTRGAAVEALMGAIYMQHGIQATSTVFKELVLPNLVLPFTLAKTLDEGIEARK